MSRSKHVTPAEEPAKQRRALRGAFVGSEGHLRGGWRLAMALAAYSVCALVVRYSLNALLAALFRAWNLRPETLAMAPGWARTLYAWQGSAVSLAVNAAVITLSLTLRRIWRLGMLRVERPLRRGVAPWLAGTLFALVSAALFLLTDSLRLQWPVASPNLTVGLPALWLLSFLGALAEEMFTKGVLYDGLRPGWGRTWAALAAVLVFILSNGGLSGTVISDINVLLLGLLTCVLYERGGLSGSVGLRWGWSFATVFLLGQGGGAHSVYRLYGVSEKLLTGGDAGFVYGLWLTFALVIALGWPIGKRLHNRIKNGAVSKKK